MGLLKTELRLTMAYLQIHPKVYWIWNHRKWCLENVPIGPGNSEEWRCGFWKGELAVIEALLDADARNCESNPAMGHETDREQSTPGTIVDMSCHRCPHPTIHLAHLSRNFNTLARRSRAISATSQHGIVEPRFWVLCGLPWTPKR